MRYILIFTLGFWPLQSWSQQNGKVADSAVQRDLCIGERLEFYSELLKEKREVNIYLPASYQDSLQHTYPLALLLDGGLDEDFLHVAGLMQFLQFPWVKAMPDCILVGVSNTDRMRDFTFKSEVPEDLKDFPQSGASAEFIQSLETEFLPLLHERYRCNNQSMLIAQSLGGLVATEILLHQPHIFNNYLIVSPSLWWNNGSLLTEAESLLQAWPSGVFPRVYFCWGNEHEVMVQQAAAMAAILGADGRLKIISEYLPEYHHGDILHEAVERGLRQLLN